MTILRLIDEFRLLEHAGAWSIDWSPDGETLAVGDDRGVVQLMTLDGTVTRQVETREARAWALAISPDGRWIATSAEAQGAQVISTDDLRRVAFWPDMYPDRPTWSLDGSYLGLDCAIQPTGGSDHCAMVVRTADWSVTARITNSGRRSGLGVGWSPDGDLIGVALARRGGALLADTTSGAVRTPLCTGNDVNAITCSPLGGRWAIGGSNFLAMADGEGELLWQRRDNDVHHLVWPAEDVLLAALLHNRRAVVLSARDGREIATTPPQGGRVRRVALSPDHQRLASTSDDGWVRMWDVSPWLAPAQPRGRARGPLAAFAARQVQTIGRGAAMAEVPGSPPTHNEMMAARACAALCGIDRPAPLALLADLIALLGGRAVDGFEPLAAEPGLRALAALGFPPEARAGLAALLIEEGGYADWAPPADILPARLLAALEAALDGPACAPLPFTPRLSRLMAAAETIDARLIALLRIVGAKSVAVDPGLPPRLAQAAARMPATLPDRTVLSARLPWRGEGRAVAPSPLGARAGIARHGDPRDLMPAELAMPQEVFLLRSLRRELTYRAKRVAEPPLMPPCVIVLDISPPTFGDVEKVLRPAAYILAATLVERGVAAALMLGGGAARMIPLGAPEDLVALWTERSLMPADADALFARAERTRRWLGEPGQPARIVLFTHTAFGAEAGPPPPGVVGLFAAQPGASHSPSIAASLAHAALITPGMSPTATARIIANVLQ